MKRWLTVLGVALAASGPVVAQHGSSASHGSASPGFSGASHGASGPSAAGFGGSRPSAPRAGAPMPSPRYGGPSAPRSVPSRTNFPSSGTVHAGFGSRAPVGYGHSVRTGGSGRVVSSSRVGTRSAGTGSAHHDRNRGQGHGQDRPRLYAYGAGVSPLGWWLGPWQFYPWLDADLSYDFWNDTGDGDTAVAMASTGADMVEDAPLPNWPNGGDPDGEAADNAAVGMQATQIDTGSPALTLVYKTGQTEQVANYVVSKSAVTVIDDHGVRSVAMAELDVPAMARINGQAGLQLPKGLQP